MVLDDGRPQGGDKAVDATTLRGAAAEREGSWYVVGLLLSADRSRVALIEKRRPKWQAGRLNGVGGRVENGETPIEAMGREFMEETGVERRVWDHIATLYTGPNVVQFFRAFGAIDRVQSMTDEKVSVWGVDEALRSGLLVPNLSWLLPLARHVRDDYEPIVVVERERHRP